MNRSEKRFVKKLGINIKSARKGMGFSQVQLCKKTRLTQGCISKLERGTGSPKAYVIARPEKVLGTVAAGIQL